MKDRNYFVVTIILLLLTVNGSNAQDSTMIMKNYKFYSWKVSYMNIPFGKNIGSELNDHVSIGNPYGLGLGLTLGIKKGNWIVKNENFITYVNSTQPGGYYFLNFDYYQTEIPRSIDIYQSFFYINTNIFTGYVIHYDNKIDIPVGLSFHYNMIPSTDFDFKNKWEGTYIPPWYGNESNYKRFKGSGIHLELQTNLNYKLTNHINLVGTAGYPIKTFSTLHTDNRSYETKFPAGLRTSVSLEYVNYQPVTLKSSDKNNIKIDFSRPSVIVGLTGGGGLSIFPNHFLMSPIVSYSAGGFLSYNILGGLYFHPEILYTHKGSKGHDEDFYFESGSAILDLNYIEIPLLLKWQLAKRSVRPTCSFGLSPAILIDAKISRPYTKGSFYVKTVKPFDLGFCFGFGLDFIKDTKTFSLDIIGNYGLQNIHKSREDMVLNNSSLMIKFGYGFGL